MACFKIKIAGVTGEVHSLFDSTKDYCRNYLSDEAPAFSVTVCREALAAQQRLLDEEAAREGFRPRVFSEPFLERTVIQEAFARELLPRDILLIHGSAVAVDGKGYLFTAKSGTGKSTHTRLWCQLLGSRAVMVNDDKPFVRVGEDGSWVCGAPWSGKHGLDSNLSVPLKAICFLDRGTRNRIRRIDPREALPLLGQACANDEHLLDRLARQTALWNLECTPDPEAAQTAFEAMQK